MKKKWSREQLNRYAGEVDNMSELLDKLGLAKSGDAYKHMKNHILRLDININHWIKKRIFPTKVATDEEVFVNDSNFPNRIVRKRIIEHNLIPHKCAKCGINNEWMGDKITLHLDHINGNRKDNRLENLRFLCPNCHSQTPTWGAKNRAKKEAADPTKCCDCNTKITSKSTRCNPCASKHKPQPTRISWPPTSELIEMVEKESFVAVGKKLGVSDNAVRKRIRNHPGG